MLSQYLSVKLKMMMLGTFEILLLHQPGTRAGEGGGGGALMRNLLSHLGLAAGALIESLFLKGRKIFTVSAHLSRLEGSDLFICSSLCSLTY